MQTIATRKQTDRRQSHSFLNLYALGLSGRRTGNRRASDTAVYVDRYEWPLFMLAVGIVLMSAMDAAFTLRLLAGGAVELNSIMAVLIEQDVRKFVVYKLGLTTMGVLMLVIHKNARLSFGFSVYRVTQAVFVGYVALMCYELWLFRLVFAAP